MNWWQCHIECVNGLWGIYWPDNSEAWNQRFKTRGWATRVLNDLNRK